MFSLQQNWRTRGQEAKSRGARGGGTTMYTHVSKCKNAILKGEKKAISVVST
jgi:hypothetical protein